MFPLKSSLARVIQNAQQTRRLRLEEMQTSGVVEELDVRPFDSFSFVFLLFVFEDVLEITGKKISLNTPNQCQSRELTRLK